MYTQLKQGKLYNQTVYTIGRLALSKHAYNRIVFRKIRPDEIICTWCSQNTLCKNSRDNRTIYSNFEYGLFLVLDNYTNIIVTIIEMEWRKHRLGIRNLQKKYNINNTILPVPPIC